MNPTDYAQDLYAILGISPSADARDIKQSYHAVARRLHPDVNPNDGSALQFRDIVMAYEILSDDRKRRQYDSVRQRIAVDPQYFLTTLTPSKRVLPIIGEPQIVYLLLQINPNPELISKENRAHVPLNLVLVLDRSKSMLGKRLERVKVAAHQIVDQLGPEDRLSVIGFSDRAEVLIPSQAVEDRQSLKSIISIMGTEGGTEIYQGLSLGMVEVQKHLNQDLVNHIILLTDGQTYDEESLSLDLAESAASIGIGISTMGIGEEWNDVFLDEIASRTGGAAAYINSPGAVVKFLDERVRSLGASFAERLSLSIAPDPDVKITSMFKLMPNPQPIENLQQPFKLGALENARPMKLLVELQMGNELKPGFRSLLRLDVTGDILSHRRTHYKVLSDISIEVAEMPPIEEPPKAIMDALGKLTLYRMQQKAEASIRAGRYEEATRRLERLSTRLLAAGHDELAQTALEEAQRVKRTQSLSPQGQKTMKFGTRLLLLGAGDADAS